MICFPILSDSDEVETEELSKSAAMLYGLIHARYIVTTAGLSAMQKKFLDRDYGECPRSFCQEQTVLPVSEK